MTFSVNLYEQRMENPEQSHEYKLDHYILSHPEPGCWRIALDQAEPGRALSDIMAVSDGSIDELGFEHARETPKYDVMDESQQRVMIASFNPRTLLMTVMPDAMSRRSENYFGLA